MTESIGERVPLIVRFHSRVSIAASRPGARYVRAAVAVGCALMLAACGGGGQDSVSAPETLAETQASPSSTAAPSSTSARETSASTTSTTGKESAQASSSKPRPTGTVTTGTTVSDEKHKAIESARQKFGSLAPDSLFDQFDSCAPNGVQNSVACDGDEVGQFQFYASDAKAASTTQLLTELRSSRVVEDTGKKVVGWSTLGSIAVITVVDNDKGLILQHMVSSDEYDPAERIYELGLAEKPASETKEPDAQDTSDSKA